MAIQLRRGAYADFDPTKMVPAEVGIVTSGDPNTDDGKAAYVAFSAGNVKRIATVDDIATDLQDATDDAVEQATARAEAAAESVESSATQIATNTADISDLKADFEQLEPGLSNDAKTALLNCFQHVAWLDHQSDYYQVLRDALYASDTIVSISAVFNQGSVVIYPDESLDNLRTMLVVTATYSDDHTGVVTEYTLSGNLVGDTSSIITVTYRDKTTTFTVAVTDYEWGSDYTWLYRADEDGLLSANENISAVTAIGSGLAVETLDNGLLNLFAATGTTEAGSLYKPIPEVATNGGVIRAKVKFKSLPASDSAYGLRMQVSNGTKCAQIVACRNISLNKMIFFTYDEDNNFQYLCDLNIDSWYVVSCELQGTKQIITINDQTFTINTLSAYSGRFTRFIIHEPGTETDPTNIDVAWISYKDNSN